MKTRRYGSGGPALRVLLVVPRFPENLWSLAGVAGFFGARSLAPNAAMATLMALTPDGVDVEYMLCDENIQELDLTVPCDLAAVTGTALSGRRMEQICRELLGRGVRVAVGGPLATLEPARMQGLAHHHFIGEAELTWPAFLRDLAAGKARPTYAQEGFVDLGSSPAPDWALAAPGDHLQLLVQSSRGCPNRCDFCDVIPLVGNRQRCKSVEQVLAEVQRAHDWGARSVFISDDNFTASPRRAKELLAALASWNRGAPRPLSFSTQGTLSMADDEALLRLLRDAGFCILFIGLETLREAGLREANKTANLGADPAGRLARLASHGLVAVLGVIVGFDADDAGVFDELEPFVERTDSLILGSSLLNAPARTPLRERLEREGRVSGERFSGARSLSTNVVFKNLDREQLVSQNLGFMARLYEPQRFGARLARWLARVEYLGPPMPEVPGRRQLLAGYLSEVFQRAERLFDRETYRLLRKALKQAMRIDPRLVLTVVEVMAQYWHFYSFVRDSS